MNLLRWAGQSRMFLNLLYSLPVSFWFCGVVPPARRLCAIFLTMPRHANVTNAPELATKMLKSNACGTCTATGHVQKGWTWSEQGSAHGPFITLLAPLVGDLWWFQESRPIPTTKTYHQQPNVPIVVAFKNQGDHSCPEAVLGRWVWHPSRWLRHVVGPVDEGGMWYGGFTISSSCPVMCLRSWCGWILEVPQGSLWSLRFLQVGIGQRLFLHCCHCKWKLQIICKKTNLAWNGKSLDLVHDYMCRAMYPLFAILKTCSGYSWTLSHSIPIQGDMLVEESTSKDDVGPLGRF